MPREFTEDQAAAAMVELVRERSADAVLPEAPVRPLASGGP